MAETDIAEFDVQLEMKDRLNYAHVLQTNITAIDRLMGKRDASMKDIQKLILNFLVSIPDAYKDQQFENDMKQVMKVRKIDIRPRNAGTPLSMAYCRKEEIPIYKTVREIKYFKLKNALTNLLHRRNMLIPKRKIEYSTGRNLEKTLADLTLDDIGDDEGV